MGPDERAIREMHTTWIDAGVRGGCRARLAPFAANNLAHLPAYAGRYAEVRGPSIAWPVWCSNLFGPGLGVISSLS